MFSLLCWEIWDSRRRFLVIIIRWLIFLNIGEEMEEEKVVVVKKNVEKKIKNCRTNKYKSLERWWKRVSRD